MAQRPPFHIPHPTFLDVKLCPIDCMLEVKVVRPQVGGVHFERLLVQLMEYDAVVTDHVV